MIEIYGATRPQIDRNTNEDAFVIGREPVPHAALCDAAGSAQQEAHHVVRFFERMIKDPQARAADFRGSAGDP
jgi:hypothetical protein